MVTFWDFAFGDDDGPFVLVESEAPTVGYRAVELAQQISVKMAKTDPQQNNCTQEQSDIVNFLVDHECCLREPLMVLAQ